MAKGLRKYVDEKFQAGQQKAFSTIVMSVSSPLLYLITSCEVPKEAWDTLKRHLERDTLANKLLFKKQYFRKEMCEGTSAPEGNEDAGR